MPEMSRTFMMAIGSLAICLTSMAVHADVIRYSHLERGAWFNDASAVGTIETITFTEHPVGLLHSQYESSHGLVFTGNGGPDIDQSDTAFPIDGFGMIASPGFGPVSVVLVFDRPMLALSADFLGSFSVELINESGVFYSTIFTGSGNPPFTGLVSETSFTSARFFKQNGTIGVDDLHFVAQAIPGPGVISVLVLAGMNRRRRRANGGP